MAGKKTKQADADSASAPETVPDAGAYRRAGLTEPEAERLVRTRECRDETQSPWEASPIGIAFWLLWRGVLKGFQSLWILVSLLIAAWFGAQIIDQSGGIAGITAEDPTLEDRLSAALNAVPPEPAAAREFWQDSLEEALRGDALRRADIELFDSIAAAGPDLIGRERLALELIAGGPDIEAVQAELLAGPAWRRQQDLDLAYRRELQRARHAQINPEELVFASEQIRTRYQRGLFNWSIAHTSAARFFRGETGGQLELTSLPGLVSPERRQARLYGGLRQYALQVCAIAPRQVAAGQPPLAGCNDAVLPRAGADPVSLGLAAIEAGMIRLSLSDSIAQRGAQILLTGHIAGRLSPAMEDLLADSLLAVFDSETAYTVFVESGRQPGQVFAAPNRVRRSFQHAVDARNHDAVAGLNRLLEQAARIGRTSSVTKAVRVLSAVDTLDEAERLQRLSVAAGERLLAVEHFLGDDMYALMDGLPPRPEPDPRLYHGLVAGLISALMVLLLTISRLTRPALVRDASRLNALDARMSRLFLGRKD